MKRLVGLIGFVIVAGISLALAAHGTGWPLRASTPMRLAYKPPDRVIVKGKPGRVMWAHEKAAKAKQDAAKTKQAATKPSTGAAAKSATAAPTPSPTKKSAEKR